MYFQNLIVLLTFLPLYFLMPKFLSQACNLFKNVEPSAVKYLKTAGFIFSIVLAFL